MPEEIHTAWVKVPNHSLEIDAYLATPIETNSTESQRAGIIVIQEIFGVNSHIQQVTERIAREGYVAIAPAIFQRTAPGFAIGYSDEETKQGRIHKDQTKASELLSDVSATIAYLKTLPLMQNAPIGTIGFCFGAHVAYLAATLPDVKVTASLYGAGIATMTPGGGEPTIARTPEIKGTLYAFFGTEDPLIPVEQIDRVEAALQAAHVNHRVFRYRATHGFFCDQRDSYNLVAATDAWQHVKELFSRLTH